MVPSIKLSWLFIPKRCGEVSGDKRKVGSNPEEVNYDHKIATSAEPQLSSRRSAASA